MIGIEPYSSREDFSKVSVSFDSDGAECAGWLYRPDRPRTSPIVVMGPGLAAERTFGYPALAEGLAEHGIATLLFDYRGFGASEGAPSGVVSVRKQLDDWTAAIDRATRLDDIDTTRLALWGHSLAGGHALRIAAEDHRVDALIAHSPIVDGRAVLRSNGYEWLGNALLAGARDRIAGTVGRRRRMPVVPPEAYDRGDRRNRSAPDDFGAESRERSRFDRALFPQPDAARALSELVPLRSDWENAIRARIVLDLWGYRPGTVADDVDVPALLVTGASDPIVPVSSVARTSRQLTAGSFLALPTDHFSLFADPWRRRLLGHAGAFLADVLES